MDGAVNFRDIGGYRTVEGRVVKWGKVYRSDSLAHLSDADLRQITQMGIKLVCDFRAPAEVAKAPDRLPPDGSTAYLHLPVVSSDFDTVAALERLKKKDVSWLTETFMIDGYMKNITAYGPVWGTVVKRLATDASRPLLFHCTAGKDRTGVCAALILDVLGVPEDTIVSDHALSNIYFGQTVDRIKDYIRSLGVDPEKLMPYLTAPRDAMEHVLAYIKQEYGSAAEYLMRAGGVGEGTLDTLRREMLEMPARDM